MSKWRWRGNAAESSVLHSKETPKGLSACPALWRRKKASELEELGTQEEGNFRARGQVAKNKQECNVKPSSKAEVGAMRRTTSGEMSRGFGIISIHTETERADFIVFSRSVDLR